LSASTPAPLMVALYFPATHNIRFMRSTIYIYIYIFDEQ